MPGISDQQITNYEKVLNTKFPLDFRAFLRALNGTDLPTLNVYGSCGEPPRNWRQLHDIWSQSVLSSARTRDGVLRYAASNICYAPKAVIADHDDAFETTRDGVPFDGDR